MQKRVLLILVGALLLLTSARTPAQAPGKQSNFGASRRI
jgi:hypothetical protein